MLVEEYQSVLAGQILCDITCYSAEPIFSELSEELAFFLKSSPAEAANYLLPISRGIVAAVERELPRLISGGAKYAT